MTQDKFGADLKKGDHIDFVHFGDHHSAQIKSFQKQVFGDIEMVEVEITVLVPAGSVSRLDHDDTPTEPVSPPARVPEKSPAEVKREEKRAEEFHAGEALAGEQRPDDQIKTKAEAQREIKKASK